MFEFIINLFLLTGALFAVFFALVIWSLVGILVFWELNSRRKEYKAYREQKKQDDDIFNTVETYRDTQ